MTRAWSRPSPAIGAAPSKAFATISRRRGRLHPPCFPLPSPPRSPFTLSHREQTRTTGTPSTPLSPRAPSLLGSGLQTRDRYQVFRGGRRSGTLAGDGRVSGAGRDIKAWVSRIGSTSLRGPCSRHGIAEAPALISAPSFRSADAKAPSASARRRTCPPSPSRSGFAGSRRGS
jgi:hypothetical protein